MPRPTPAGSPTTQDGSTQGWCHHAVPLARAGFLESEFLLLTHRDTKVLQHPSTIQPNVNLSVSVQKPNQQPHWQHQNDAFPAIKKKSLLQEKQLWFWHYSITGSLQLPFSILLRKKKVLLNLVILQHLQPPKIQNCCLVSENVLNISIYTSVGHTAFIYTNDGLSWNCIYEMYIFNLNTQYTLHLICMLHLLNTLKSAM